jgi:hypothetical protein
VDVACVSTIDNFKNYEHIFNFKYKYISPLYQFSKLCDFISHIKYDTYDWYVKIRTEIELLEQIDFKSLCDISVNARTRVYVGPKIIKYGSSVGGNGGWSIVTGYSSHSSHSEDIILDDQIFIFHKNVVEQGGFNQLIDDNLRNERNQNEWFHTNIWKNRNINLNPIGLNLRIHHNSEEMSYSGNINM